MQTEVRCILEDIERLANTAEELVNDALLVEKSRQLREVRNTISTLDTKGVSAPDELQGLESLLAEEITRRESAFSALSTVRERLIGVANNIDSVVNSRKIRREWLKKKRVKSENTTPASKFQDVILDVLYDMGGKGESAEIVKMVYKKMEPALLPGDFEPRPNNGSTMPLWKKTIYAAKNILVYKGMLESDSPRGIWELSIDMDSIQRKTA